jgi:hypothetical protein
LKTINHWTLSKQCPRIFKKIANKILSRQVIDDINVCPPHIG